MSRTLRIHKIDQLLHNRHHVSIPDLLAELEVSLATLKRDLEFMRLYLNAPIIFDRELKAYRFDKMNLDGPRYELPGLWLNSAEVHALLAANHLLENIEPGLLGQHVAPLKHRLMTLLVQEGVDPNLIRQRIRLVSSLKRHPLSRHFEVIARATLDGLRLLVSHHNRHTGQTTCRELSPQRLTHYRENWYLDSWCHAREDIRSFAIDAMVEVELLTEKARRIDEKTLSARLDSGYGIFNGSTPQWAVIDFNPRRAQWASRIIWHEQQQATWLDNGCYRISLPFHDDRELLNDILSYGQDVVVKAPPSLQAKVVASYREALAQYALTPAP